MRTVSTVLLFFVLCFPALTFSATTTHSIRAEWTGYSPPAGYTVSGYRLYQEGTVACQTSSPSATSIDCTVSLSNDSTSFTLTVAFANGTQSPHSAPFSFTRPSGNQLQAPQGFQSTSSVTPTSLTLWPNDAVPDIVDAGSDGAQELGVKFRSDVSGHITGIRFYKATTNTGTHKANLWSSTGTLLATATFINETASGWQQVNFATPVAITANTVYIASYFCPAGHQSVDRSYFESKGMDTAPLHALASGVSGANGVYAYGSSSVFPNSSYFNTNYWVDVMFQQ